MSQTTPTNWFSLPRIAFWLLLAIFITLQFRLWVGEGGISDIWALREAIERQERENHLIEQRNLRLRAEVDSLKNGLTAVEERARTRLGMIKEDETFFLIIEDQP